MRPPSTDLVWSRAIVPQRPLERESDILRNLDPAHARQEDAPIQADEVRFLFADDRWVTLARASVCDRFPDQLGDVEHEVGLDLLRVGRHAHLADTDTHDIVESPVRLGVAEMEDRPDDLSTSGWVCTPVPMTRS